MKKLVLKSILATTLFVSVPGMLALFNACQKNVGDVYSENTEDPNPDFEISSVDYASDTEELSSGCTLTFKVEYINREDTKSIYSTVMNFYADDKIKESIVLESVEANKTYELLFNCENTCAGSHDYKFVINQSSDGSLIVAENNTDNNSMSADIDIAVKCLLVEQEEIVAPESVLEEANNDSSADLGKVMQTEGISVAANEEAVKTTYDANTVVLVSSVETAAGTVDKRKKIIAIKHNSVISEDNQLMEATTGLIEQVSKADKRISFYNSIDTLTYINGELFFITSSDNSNANSCIEPGNLQLLFNDKEASSLFIGELDVLFASYDEEEVLDKAPVVLTEILTAYNFTQGGVDNPPVFTFEIISSDELCAKECVEGVEIEKYPYPGFILYFEDDRTGGAMLQGTDEVITSFTKIPDCNTSNNDSYLFIDCGGNEVSFVFDEKRFIKETNNPCVNKVHN